MTMDANEQAETVLLFDSQKRLIPASTSAFKISRGPKRQIDQLYKDSLTIYRNGTVRKIERIEILGLLGRHYRPATSQRRQRRNSSDRTPFC
jgi:hypothetical protein